MEAFILKPFIAIILIAISTSLLGVFTLWNKLSYFSDSLSHSILLGLVLGVILEQNQALMLVVFCIVFSIILAISLKNQYFSKDTLIMILSYFSIALAVVLKDVFMQDFIFTSYIFGDILTVGNTEIYLLFFIMILVIFYIKISFKKMLLINISKDLAKIEGVRTEFWNLLFLMIMSILIAFSVKIVGVFLMTALLILPAAIARIFAVSAKQMLVLSLIISVTISIFSFQIANIYNLSISPMIVIIFSIIFAISLFFKKIKQ